MLSHGQVNVPVGPLALFSEGRVAASSMRIFMCLSSSLSLMSVLSANYHSEFSEKKVALPWGSVELARDADEGIW